MSVCALLERRGYRRHEVGEMTRWYALRVVQHPENSDGKLDLQWDYPAEESLPQDDFYRRKLDLRKYPAHLIDLKLAAILGGR